jgi:hypothetical protein
MEPCRAQVSEMSPNETLMSADEPMSPGGKPWTPRAWAGSKPAFFRSPAGLQRDPTFNVDCPRSLFWARWRHLGYCNWAMITCRTIRGLRLARSGSVAGLGDVVCRALTTTTCWPGCQHRARPLVYRRSPAGRRGDAGRAGIRGDVGDGPRGEVTTTFSDTALGFAGELRLARSRSFAG